MSKKQLGLIVNPVAGMGGRVALKGSDGEAILQRARELGAVPESPTKAIQALQILTKIRDQFDLITYPGEMGEDEAKEAGYEVEVIGLIEKGSTTFIDTKNAAKEMMDMGIDLIIFAGGDGTARNIYDTVGSRVAVVGIPAGVKIHSGVYATTARSAGELALLYLTGKIERVRETEVMDIDEEAFRDGRVTAKLYGYLKVPYEERLVQGLKSGGLEGEVSALLSIAEHIIENMIQDVTYIIGPGTTTRAIMEQLGLPNTLLGVDAVRNKQLIASDVSESDLLRLIGNDKAKIIVTIIGGQGYIFGRGNQQISPRVLEKVGKENIIIIAPQNKVTSLSHKRLLIDTGDYDVNAKLSGYYRVVVGLDREVILKAE